MERVIKDIFLKLMLNILKNYINFVMIYHFLPERMKIEKVKNLVSDFYDKTKQVIEIRNLKQALKSVHKVIHFNQNAWVKPYIDMNTDLTKKAKNDFMKNAVFGKTMENVRRHRDIKLVTTVRRRNHLISEPSYHSR